MKNNKLLIILLSTLFTIYVGYGQTKTKWKGFDKTSFIFKGKKAQIIFPKKGLPDKQWLWRARFPDYHTEVDSILLTKGFHVIYVDTDNQFGSPKAVNTWNHFYDYVLKTYKLTPKVALHGHSRGGLFIYNWAKENPEKVACIYGDAVVCDFKSWPGGFGTSEGGKKEWDKVKVEYGFDNDLEAVTYNNNPIDKLEALAKEKVPILHTISLKDSVVPPEENSLLLVNNYIRLGGIATIMPCNSGVQKSYGHHYKIDDLNIVVDFIVANSTKKDSLNSLVYHDQKK